MRNNIDYLTLISPKILIRCGFMIEKSYTNPTTSDFGRYISRLTLSLKHKEVRCVDNLSTLGNIAINKHICKPIIEKDICLVNLRPLPRVSQHNWVYQNINIIKEELI